MENELERALREAIEAEHDTARSAARRIDLAEDPEIRASRGGTLVEVRSPLPPISGWQPPRRSVGEALRTLPGGAVLKPLWILVREVLFIGLLFWLVLVALAMWQTSPPADVLVERNTAVITALVAAMSLRLAWAVVRRAVLDALTD
jgi:hypothetical protein